MTMEEIPVRTLRNDGGRVLDRVSRGESLTVTRDGTPIAQLQPLQRQPLPMAEILEKMKNAPKVDYERFRADIDNLFDSEL